MPATPSSGSSSAPAPATSVSALISDVQRLLGGFAGGTMNRLATAMDTNTIQVVMEFPGVGVSANVVLGIDEEELYVWEWTGATKIATVQRGYMGSTPQSHSAGDLVEINPRFSRWAIMRVLYEEIQSWSPHLYAIEDTTITATGDRRGFDLEGVSASNFLHAIEVLAQPYATVGATSNGAWTSIPYRIERGLDNTDFNSTLSLTLESPIGHMTSRKLRVRYAREFNLSTWNADTDAVSGVGLNQGWLDIATYGAAARLLWREEARRSARFAQGENRRAEEVPTGGAGAAATQFQKYRDARLREEAAQLVHREGMRGF